MLGLRDWTQIEASDRWPTIVMGNGASCAVSSRFAYSSLLRQAALTSEDLALFNALSTVNFEEILDRLETAETVCRQLGHNDAEVAVGPKACPLPKGQRRR